MRLTRIMTLFILALVGLQSTLVAQQQSQKKAPPTFKETVDSCIIIVRKETDDWLKFKHSQFDAYIKSDGITVSMLGTDKERFSFKKCMNEKGHPLE